MRRNIAQVLESDQYKERTKQVVERFKETEKEAVRLFEDRIRDENFALVQIQMGPFSKPEIAPLINGEPVPLDRLEALTLQEKFSPDELRRLRGRSTASCGSSWRTPSSKARDVKRKLREELTQLEKEFGRPIIAEALDDIREEYPGRQGGGIPRPGARRGSLQHGAVPRQGERGRGGAGPPAAGRGRALPSLPRQRPGGQHREWNARRSSWRPRPTTGTSSGPSRRWSTGPGTGGATFFTSRPAACCAPTADSSSSTCSTPSSSRASGPPSSAPSRTSRSTSRSSTPCISSPPARPNRSRSRSTCGWRSSAIPRATTSSPAWIPTSPRSSR